ncbi:MAG TPA: acyl carrier protein [Amycolatopsis sp.]|uniref:acyl carrier protein n=1 Tax=Amycolatopsis sp. TaxID=37632 RepID=UPI002B459524|nr:acyl carrier protein [Amycolatopsis sp.]HKS49402.1 acyl carrier protein [Amycolatopsis sp.]
MNALAAEIKGIVCELLALDPTEVDESTPFDEFGMSSTMRVRLLATVETHFDVLLDIDQLYRLTDLRGVEAVVSEALERRAAERP